MPTIHQIEANRRNAQKSTGPRTPEGKAVSPMNALKTGIGAESQIIRGEDPDAFKALTAEYYDQYRPATPQERCLVDSLIRSEWLQRRLTRVETRFWERRLDTCVGETTPLGEVCPGLTETLAHIQRRIDSAGRHYRASLRELERLRKNADSAPRPLPPAPRQPIDTEPPSPEIGFVPPNAPSPQNLCVSAPPSPVCPPPPPPPRSLPR